jgi:DNA-binding NtrC family response regulator
MSFQRVGDEDTLRVDVRVISATNKDLAEEVAAGRFREDLFYRLCVVPVHLPALRERRSDVPVLDAMVDYEWPGNVRELENAIRYALVKCRAEVILPEHLPLKLVQGEISAEISPRKARKKQRRRKLDAESVRQALEEAGGNKVEAARLLGVSRATLYRFLDNSGAVSEVGAAQFHT